MARWQTATNPPRVSQSLIDRAKKRDVRKIDDFTWIVIGNPKLDDKFPDYQVRFDGDSWTCTCHNTNHGHTRARRGCSHVLAVQYADDVDADDIDADPDQVEGGAPKEPGEKTQVSGHAQPSQGTPVEGRDGEGGRSQPRRSSSRPEDRVKTPSAALVEELGKPPLPEWFNGYRRGQLTAARKIAAALETHDLVVMEGPTGVGKTIIAETARRLMAARGLYLCETKSLQNQFSGDFDYCAVLKGRSNYPTADHPDMFRPGEAWSITAAECSKRKTTLPACPKCPTGEVAPSSDPVYHCATCHPIHDCPYESAKSAALRNDLSVLNTSYILSEANGPGKFSNSHDLAIADEADTLESILMGHVTFELRKAWQDRLGIGPPAKKTVQDAWIEWAENELGPALEEYSPPKDDDPRSIRVRNGYDRLVESAKHLVSGLPEGRYIYTGYNDSDTIIFRPVQVDSIGKEMLFAHAPKWLLMSATILDPAELLDSLGWDKSFETVMLPCPFPKGNRPIRVFPAGDMSRKNQDATIGGMVDKIKEITTQRHGKNKVLVHTVSYVLARKIVAGLNSRRVITYTKSSERDGALNRYLESDNGILVAPSLNRGVDLPHEACRCVIVAKVPFPNLGDRQVAARLHSPGGRLWYDMLTLRDLVQMTGRGVRSSSDWAESWILDRQFIERIWKGDSKRFLPQWWTEALDWTGGEGVNVKKPGEG